LKSSASAGFFCKKSDLRYTFVDAGKLSGGHGVPLFPVQLIRPKKWGQSQAALGRLTPIEFETMLTTPVAPAA
jgi:hypothetical protein